MICVFLSLFPSNHFERKKPMAKNHFSTMSQGQGIPFINGNMVIATPVIKQITIGISVNVEYNGKTLNHTFEPRETIEEIVSYFADDLHMDFNFKSDRDKFNAFIGNTRLCWTYHIAYYAKKFNNRKIITINVLNKGSVPCFRNAIIMGYSANEIASLINDLNTILPAAQWFEKWEADQYQNYLMPPPPPVPQPVQPPPQPIIIASSSDDSDDSTFDDESE